VGSSLHIKGVYLGLAVATNRTLILPDATKWVFATSCADQRSECYFLPITKCNTSHHVQGWENAPSMNFDESYPSLRIVKIPDNMQTPNLTWFSRGTFVPPPWNHKTIYWWRAQASKYLTRPSQNTIDIVAREQRKVFPPDGVIPHPIVSMHVRHGDKYAETAEKPFSEYMKIFQEFAARHNIVHVYLGTEDPAVIEEALNNYTQYKFYYIDTQTTRNNKSPMDTVQINGGADLMNVSLSNLYIQIQGDVFMGTRSSNWCRLIDEVRKTNGKGRVPYLSPESTIWIEDK